MEFATIKDAKDFLANAIAAEAKREGLPLSEIERKMLYFSETDWTLSDMAAVSAEFDHDYDEDAYEQKIAGLVQKLEERIHAENPAEEEKWNEASSLLSEGDHYLSVLIVMARESQTVHNAFIPTLDVPIVRPPHDRLRLWLLAFAVVFILLASAGLYAWLFGR